MILEFFHFILSLLSFHFEKPTLSEAVSDILRKGRMVRDKKRGGGDPISPILYLKLTLLNLFMSEWLGITLVL